MFFPLFTQERWSLFEVVHSWWAFHVLAGLRCQGLQYFQELMDREALFFFGRGQEEGLQRDDGGVGAACDPTQDRERHLGSKAQKQVTEALSTASSTSLTSPMGYQKGTSALHDIPSPAPPFPSAASPMPQPSQ